MIRIDAREGLLEIEVVDYEFDYQRRLKFGFDYDANWLVLRFELSVFGEKHIMSAPCLLATELANLARNMKLVGIGRICNYSSDFLEPYFAISFSREGDVFFLHTEILIDEKCSIGNRFVIAKELDVDSWNCLLRQVEHASREFPIRAQIPFRWLL